MALRTYKIRVWGIVQGVGFRPFVAKLADRLGVRGEVLNAGGLVEISATCVESLACEFIEAMKREKPGPAEIIHIHREEIPYAEFDGFVIADSERGEDEGAMIPADLSVCKNCLAEMGDPGNRRYGHPFISCMECGPRYTIIDRLPYDRENTSMDDFEMCPFCLSQYGGRGDRRYHAQTISCHECGPRVIFRDPWGGEAGGEADDLIGMMVEFLRGGEVIAVKGIGGYNLICDPFEDRAVAALRELKGREHKPFAAMFADTAGIEGYCEVGDVEKNLLESSAKPILLLERRPRGSLPMPREFEKSRFIGAFLPSAGLHRLLLEAYGKPLIVTSANISGAPMIKDDREMFEFASARGKLLAGTFYNRRDIRVAMDDSVARVIDGRPQMIRRSKGYAPIPLRIRAHGLAPDNRVMMLACGGQLKNSFSLSKGPFAYISQYFGDLDSMEVMRQYEEAVERLGQFFGIVPDTVVCDMHPLYETTKFAESYVAKNGAKLLKTQHHHAHVASVMAEHGLTGPVIGVSFDGTGYGEDGRIWGGEFLICEGSGFSRDAHLKYISMPGGDQSMKDAWKSAMGYALAYSSGRFAKCADDEIAIDISDILEQSDIRKNGNWDVVEKAVANRINTVESSSMGRLFDAVASLLDICGENSYEGECAIKLEDAAARARKCPGRSRIDDLALAFHRRIAAAVLERCRRIREMRGIGEVALTGGVFQNRILMEDTLGLLRREGFDVYYNISVSPNDGGIALGQNFLGICGRIETGR